MTPFLILISLISLVMLSATGRFYFYLLMGEMVLLLSPLTDWYIRKAGIHLKLLRFVSYFSYMNLALLRGFFRFLGGIDSGVWNPTKRN